MGLREDLISRFGPRVEAVPMPDGGEPCHVRRLTAAEGLPLMSATGEDLLVGILVLAACDRDGARVFADGDTEAVRSMGLVYCFVAGQAALRVNGLMDESAVSGKSGTTPAGSSPSG